ncbi:hypothetical protein BABINDRAFT_174910 [Babjeviella inositovora NRRL Y-12698]|uniref:GATA-type domain-containing protein n=1 Tax=Babjeviella inositovora NRRL Y-12698 TaxID=984486 RepID=A0A1E3QTV9_9ASCO|nr:uncharacterized protein BABINDRAFT_174910 [Babjeviella inositovora NRRL Y-12698]ODQ81123.1 hypothetical protein BABINDRAFT_174910 [Babjeviella inositovora NRRL Y-12698]
MPTNTGLRLPSISTITAKAFNAHSPRSAASPLLDRKEHGFTDTPNSLKLAATYSSSDSLNHAIENARKATRMLEEYRDRQNSPPQQPRSHSFSTPSHIEHNATGSPLSYPTPPPPPQTFHPYYAPPTMVPQLIPQPMQAPALNEPQCQRCGSTETPEWRRGPNGSRTLCNACGLYHAKLVKRKGPEAAAKEIMQKKIRVTNAKNGQKILISAASGSRGSSKGKHVVLNQMQYDKLNHQLAQQQHQMHQMHTQQMPPQGYYPVPAYGYYPPPLTMVPTTVAPPHYTGYPIEAHMHPLEQRH